MNQIRRATALLHRRIRLDLRGPLGHIVRFFAAGAMLFTIFASLQSSLTVGSPGLTVFRWIVWCDSLLISAASITVFSAAIAGERELGSLSLLRMTGASPLALLLGQGVSGVVIGMLLLAVQFPFVVLTITLGGVLWDQVLATFLALLAHMVLCAGIGLFFSTVCKRSGSAALYSLLTQLGLWLGPWGLRTLATAAQSAGRITMAHEAQVDRITTWVDQHLVYTRLSEIATSFGGVDLIGQQFWFSISAGAVLIGLAALLLDFRPVEVATATPINLSLAFWKGSGRAWPQLAITGKDFRQFMGGFGGVIARLIIYIGVPLFFTWLIDVYTDAPLQRVDYESAVFWTGMAFLLVEANAIAARLFRNEIAQQTWATLTLLPRPLLATVGEKLLGAFLGVLPGIFVCVIAAMMSEDVQDSFRRMYEQGEELYILILLPTVWIAFTAACSMVFVSFAPTVAVFCGLVGFFLHYAVTILFAQMLMRPGWMTSRNFNVLYLTIASTINLACFATATLRLRALTRKD